MYCSNCGKELKEGAKFCGNCGTKFEIQTDIESHNKRLEEKKKEVASDIKKETKGKGTLRKIIILAVVIFIILVISVAIVLLNKKSYTNAQYSEDSSLTNEIENTNQTIIEEKEITIPLGIEAKGIAKILKENNIISNEQDFIEYIELNNIENFQAGTYYVKENMDLEEIADMLQSGRMYMSDAGITYNINNVEQEISNKTGNSISKEKNIDEETIEKILKCWKKVSDYGTDNLEKVLFENEGQNGDSDGYTDGLYLVYSNPDKEGLYITSWLMDDINTTVHYGEDPAFSGSTQKYGELTEGYIVYKKNNINNIYFTGEEFVRFLEEKL